MTEDDFDTPCFIIGNGPSLRGFDLHRLARFTTIGMNAAYRHWDRIGWYPDHYCCLDEQLVLTHHEHILRMIDEGQVRSAFLSARLLDLHPDRARDSRIHFLESFYPSMDPLRRTRHVLPLFESSFFKGGQARVTTGSHAVRYAAFLGYRALYLLGIDLRYQERIAEAEPVEGLVLRMARTPQSNPNYFFDDYQREGDLYNIPNPPAHAGGLHIEAFRDLAEDFAGSPEVTLANLNEMSLLREEKIVPFVPLEHVIAGKDTPQTNHPLPAPCSGKELEELRQRFDKRQRCFLIGTGASLDRTNLERLRDEVTFAADDFFQKVGDLSWVPTFYIVDDRNFAEAEADFINAINGPIRFLPRDLAHCLLPGEDVLYYDPDAAGTRRDAERSEDALEARNGGSALPSCLRLARALGFEEIYLVGMDEDELCLKRAQDMDGLVAEPRDRPGAGSARTGFRWHDPAPARSSAPERVGSRKNDRQIYDATVGGELKVFPRVAFDSLFEEQDREQFPRTLLIDMTTFGGGTATGELKSALMGDIPAEKLMRIHAPASGHVTLAFGGASNAQNATVLGTGDPDLLRAGATFDPEVILYRPVADRPDLHALAMRLIAELDRPLAIWLMDDWPERLRRADIRRYREMDKDLRDLLAMAAERYAISEQMAQVFGRRYGVPFTVLRNGICFHDWSTAPRSTTTEPNRPLLVRFAGSLAPDMSSESVYTVAKVVSELSAAIPVRMEIRTREHWAVGQEDRYGGLPGVSFDTRQVTPAEYRAWLQGADVVVMAYNFDHCSVEYIRHSFANKLPECLATGAAVFAYGSDQVATMRTLAAIDGVTAVTEESPAAVAAAMKQLLQDGEVRLASGRKTQDHAFKNFGLDPMRMTLVRGLSRAAGLRARAASLRSSPNTSPTRVPPSPAVPVPGERAIRHSPPGERRTIFLLGSQAAADDAVARAVAGRATMLLGGTAAPSNDLAPSFFANLAAPMPNDQLALVRGLLNGSTIRRFLLRQETVVRLGELARDDRLISAEPLGRTIPSMGHPPFTTATHAAIWAGMLGFREIVLVGVGLPVTGADPSDVRAEGWANASPILSSMGVTVSTLQPAHLLEGEWHSSLERFSL